MATYIGIDPGKGGGIAALFENGHVNAVIGMPETDADLLAFLRTCSVADYVKATIERVHSLPQQGHVGAFTFGKGYGALRMALAAAGIPYDEVVPRKWQAYMGCLTKGDKNVSKARAQQLFPHMRITHSNADCLLIAEYCRRVHLGIRV